MHISILEDGYHKKVNEDMAKYRSVVLQRRVAALCSGFRATRSYLSPIGFWRHENPH